MSSNIISLHNTFNAQSNVYDLSLVQFVGVWDYENMKCDIYESIKQAAKHEYNYSTIPAKLTGKLDNMAKQNDMYPIYNSDFKHSQHFFQMGLDFFIYTTTFREL